MKVIYRYFLKYTLLLLALIHILGLNTFSYASDEDLVYKWLYRQLNKRTGLLSSQQDNIASTYNNALGVIAFTLINDKKSLKKARKILKFLAHVGK